MTDTPANDQHPDLLRIPITHRNVADLLAVAARLPLAHTILLAERTDGRIALLTTDLSAAEANWMVDRLKQILLGSEPERVGEGNDDAG